MIVKAFMAIINAIIDVVMAILPDIPVLPSFVGESLHFMGQLMTGSAGMIRYVLGDIVYLGALDYIIITNSIKIFMTIFGWIKKWILLR